MATTICSMRPRGATQATVVVEDGALIFMKLFGDEDMDEIRLDLTSVVADLCAFGYELSLAEQAGSELLVSQVEVGEVYVGVPDGRELEDVAVTCTLVGPDGSPVATLGWEALAALVVKGLASWITNGVAEALAGNDEPEMPPGA